MDRKWIGVFLTLAIWNGVRGAMNCDILVDGVRFDLKGLAGAHSVTTIKSTPPSIQNLTWTLDPCGPLQKSSDLPADAQCQVGTQVCGIQSVLLPESGKSTITEIIPIAGDIDGKLVDAQFVRLKTSTLPEDSGKEGLRATLNGGRWGEKRDVKAVIEFLCAPECTSSNLLNCGVDVSSWDEIGTVVFNWRTSLACEKKSDDKQPPPPPPDDDDDDKKNHGGGGGLGWFGWLCIIVFLVVAGYIIAGSWANYNRYGNTGLDMIPHSDTLRDVPYLLRDFGRKIANTFSGSGSRGGYSAV